MNRIELSLKEEETILEAVEKILEPYGLEVEIREEFAFDECSFIITDVDNVSDFCKFIDEYGFDIENNDVLSDLYFYYEEHKAVVETMFSHLCEFTNVAGKRPNDFIEFLVVVEE